MPTQARLERPSRSGLPHSEGPPSPVQVLPHFPGVLTQPLLCQPFYCVLLIVSISHQRSSCYNVFFLMLACSAWEQNVCSMLLYIC